MSRPVALLNAFRHEEDEPERFYDLLATDTADQLFRVTSRTRLRVLDVGGGPGYLARVLERAGAECVTVDVDAGELRLHGRIPHRAAVADGLALPFADASFEVVHASNVLEHVRRPWALLEEMVRVVVPGGIVQCSFTNWLSPWGGHETSPWHWFGGDRAARRYERRHGLPPKNRYGESLFPLSVGAALAWARAHPDVDLVDAFPRYYPRWAKVVVSLPGVREVLTWNLSLVLRRRF